MNSRRALFSYIDLGWTQGCKDYPSASVSYFQTGLWLKKKPPLWPCLDVSKWNEVRRRVSVSESWALCASASMSSSGHKKNENVNKSSLVWTEETQKRKKIWERHGFDSNSIPSHSSFYDSHADANVDDDDEDRHSHSGKKDFWALTHPSISSPLAQFNFWSPK